MIMTKQEALRQVLAEMDALSPEDLRATLDAHKDGAVASALREASVFIASLNMPAAGTKVIAQMSHANGQTTIAELIRVDEDDVDWRTSDDNSEISYDWTVVAYLPV